MGPPPWGANLTRFIGTSVGALDGFGIGGRTVLAGVWLDVGRHASMAGCIGVGEHSLLAQVDSRLSTAHAAGTAVGLSPWGMASLVFCPWFCALSKFWTALHRWIVDQSVAFLMGLRP